MPTDRRRTSALRILRSAPLLLALLAAPASGASDPSGATALIQKTVDDVIVILNDSALDTAGRRSRIEKIAWDRFDFVTMSQLVVARYWREFSPEQKETFIREFKAFLARTYGERIDRYSEETVLVVGQAPAPRGDVKVMTEIVGGNYGGAEVEYRLRAEDGIWRVIDVKVEGISLVLNYRDQFRSILSRNGPQGLIDRLSDRNAEFAASP